jgi:fluoroacetyl-CoA thioesterase
MSLEQGPCSDPIQPGLQGEVRLVVAEEHTAQHLGSGSVKVLATPQMVLLMERAGVEAVDHLLPEGYRTVGAHLNVRHLAPTPIGFEVTATAELIEVQGRRLTFHVQVRDVAPNQKPMTAQLVGDGTHQRAIINVDRFSERVAQRAQ